MQIENAIDHNIYRHTCRSSLFRRHRKLAATFASCKLCHIYLCSQKLIPISFFCCSWRYLIMNNGVREDKLFCEWLLSANFQFLSHLRSFFPIRQRSFYDVSAEYLLIRHIVVDRQVLYNLQKWKTLEVTLTVRFEKSLFYRRIEPFYSI